MLSETVKIIVPGKQTYGNAAIQKAKPPAKTLVLSDSIAQEIKISEFNKYIKYDRANLVTLPGSTLGHWMHYLDIHLEDRNAEKVIIRVRFNDVINLFCPNVPFMDKPGSWFLLAKRLFHRCFHTFC